jgi:hypothetical protein
MTKQTKSKEGRSAKRIKSNQNKNVSKAHGRGLKTSTGAGCEARLEARQSFGISYVNTLKECIYSVDAFVPIRFFLSCLYVIIKQQEGRNRQKRIHLSKLYHLKEKDHSIALDKHSFSSIQVMWYVWVLKHGEGKNPCRNPTFMFYFFRFLVPSK